MTAFMGCFFIPNSKKPFHNMDKKTSM